MSTFKLLLGNKVNYSHIALSLSLLYFLTACTLPVKETKTDTEILQQRARARWESLIRQDWQSAYSFEPPAYRETYNLAHFKSRYGTSVSWKTIKIKAVELKTEYDIATVRLDLGYQFLMPGAGVTKSTKPLVERWIKKNQQWWYLHE